MEAALDGQLDLCEDEDVQVGVGCLSFQQQPTSILVLDSSFGYQRVAVVLQRRKREHTEDQRHFGTASERSRTNRSYSSQLVTSSAIKSELY